MAEHMELEGYSVVAFAPPGRIIGPAPEPGGGYRGECWGCYRFTTSTVHDTMRDAVHDTELRLHRCKDNLAL